LTITNRFSLPDPFLAFIRRDDYTKGDADYSTTELISPPKQKILQRRHWNELTEDVTDRVFAMSGTVKHHILQQIAEREPERYIAEVRYYKDYDGIKVGGQIDLYDKKDGTLYDWKETGTFKTSNGLPEEWEVQANINRTLLEANGIEVKRMVYVAMYKDWSKPKARRTANFPPSPLDPIEVPMWRTGKADALIRERILVHEAAKNAADDDIPVCTPEERWQDPDIFAVKKKKDAARAEKGGLYTNKLEAEKHAAKISGIIEFRKSEPTRCIDYCSVREFCSFGKHIVMP
jgi:hypothetical protein